MITANKSKIDFTKKHINLNSDIIKDKLNIYKQKYVAFKGDNLFFNDYISGVFSIDIFVYNEIISFDYNKNSSLFFTEEYKLSEHNIVTNFFEDKFDLNYVTDKIIKKLISKIRSFLCGLQTELLTFESQYNLLIKKKYITNLLSNAELFEIFLNVNRYVSNVSNYNKEYINQVKKNNEKMFVHIIIELLYFGTGKENIPYTILDSLKEWTNDLDSFDTIKSIILDEHNKSLLYKTKENIMNFFQDDNNILYEIFIFLSLKFNLLKIEEFSLLQEKGLLNALINKILFILGKEESKKHNLYYIFNQIYSNNLKITSEITLGKYYEQSFIISVWTFDFITNYFENIAGENAKIICLLNIPQWLLYKRNKKYYLLFWSRILCNNIYIEFYENDTVSNIKTAEPIITDLIEHKKAISNLFEMSESTFENLVHNNIS